MWKDPTRLQVDPCLLLCRDLQASFVLGLVQSHSAAETALGMRRANEFQDGLVTAQWLPRPVQTEGTEQAMLNRIPLRCARREMGHRDRQVELVRQGLQLGFPQPTAGTVSSAIIRLNQQVIVTRIPINLPRRRSPWQFLGVTASLAHSNLLFRLQSPDLCSAKLVSCKWLQLVSRNSLRRTATTTRTTAIVPMASWKLT